jgi:hypothetical protein
MIVFEFKLVESSKYALENILIEPIKFTWTRLYRPGNRIIESLANALEAATTEFMLL